MRAKLFSKKSLSVMAIVVAIGALLGGSLLVAQTYFTEVEGGGLIFRQVNPVIRYAGDLSFQNLSATVRFKPLTATATLDFANATTNTCSADLDITVTGAVAGDAVKVGAPGALGVKTGSFFFAWVSTANTVTVRHCNLSSGSADPESGTYRVDVFAH